MLSEQVRAFLGKKLSKQEKEQLNISKPGAKWADAVAAALVKKRAAGDVRAIKLIREMAPTERQKPEMISVRVVE